MQNYLNAMLACTRSVNPLFDFLGARLISATAGEAVVSLPVSRNLQQGAGLVAGGILAAMADESMAHAVMSLLGPDQGIVTVEMNIRFLRASKPDQEGCITAEAHVVKPGRTIMAADARVNDPSGRLLAVAGGSFQVISSAP